MKYRNILIVDDSETSRMIIKRCFTIAGFPDSVYFEAEDALVALSLIEKNSIDLIVTDITMPKMDGMTFIKRVAVIERSHNIPIIIISSMANKEMITQLEEAKIVAVIKKPISPVKILEALEEPNG